MRLVLVNPNTSVAVTADMLALAHAEAGAGVEIIGLTVPIGAATIIDEAMLAEAAEAVGMMAEQIAADAPDGVIVAAFGNPGAAQLRTKLTVPVTGIGEAAMREAGSLGCRFAVVTTTPDLVQAIGRDVDRLGLTDRFAGVVLTEGDTLHVMADLYRMTEALHIACSRAIHRGARAIVIGGGPLAKSAVEMRRRLRFPVIEPVSAAVRSIVMR